MNSDIKTAEKMEFKKRKTPQVRQTLTSKYRMLKANPLLMYELGKKVTSSENKDESFFTPLKTLVSVFDASTEAQSKAVASNKMHNKTIVNTSMAKPKTVSKPTWNKPLPREKPTLESRRKLLNQYTIIRKNQQKGTSQTQKVGPKNVSEVTIPTAVKENGNAVPKDVNSCKIPSTSDRRSTIIVKTPSINQKLVIEPCDTVNHNNQNTQDSSIDTTHKTQNLGTLLNINNTSGSISLQSLNNKSPSVFVPKQHENAQDLIIEKSSLTPMQGTKNTQLQAKTLTPSNYTSRSTLFATPHRKKSIQISNSNSKDMAKRLSEWLRCKGKNVREYNHLKCFGIHAENKKINDLELEEKENKIDVNLSVKNSNDICEEIKPLLEDFNLKTVAEEALIDVHKLILDGYPPEQCEIWLRLIKQKHRPVEEKPQYWECRAALEQTKGNINLAVECYKNAIIQGAEVKSVDKCLDELLRKFSLLDINGEADAYSNNNERSKIVKEARNIFKSSIIQFAVQERTFKKKGNEGITIEKKFIATPVRRSTRLSRSAFTSTPGIHIYSSLQEIDSSMRDNLNFQCNNALRE